MKTERMSLPDTKHGMTDIIYHEGRLILVFKDEYAAMVYADKHLKPDTWQSVCCGGPYNAIELHP